MAHLSHAIQRVNASLFGKLSRQLVQQAVEQSNYTYRHRKLGPTETVLLCVMMILKANASLAAARIISGGVFSAAALCKARRRLPLALLKSLNQLILARWHKPGQPRILLVDVCNYYLPDRYALRRRYRHPRQKKPAGRRSDYPQMRVLSVFDLHTGMMIGQFDFPSDRHESPMLRQLLSVVRPGDTLIFDRGFVSYGNLQRLQKHGIHFVARLPSSLQAKPTGRRRFLHPGRQGSGQVVWDKPARRSQGTTLSGWQRLGAQLELRQLSLKVTQGRSRGRVRLITDLKQTGARQIANWYRRRWEIETGFRHLKKTLKLEFFTGKSIEGVKIELHLRQMAYNLVRTVMLQAARRGHVACNRISFAQAALLLHGEEARLDCLEVLPKRQRTSRPRRLKYRGTNYRYLQSKPTPQRKVA
jgi:hypothetical protein